MDSLTHGLRLLTRAAIVVALVALPACQDDESVPTAPEPTVDCTASLSITDSTATSPVFRITLETEWNDGIDVEWSTTGPGVAEFLEGDEEPSASVRRVRVTESGDYTIVATITGVVGCLELRVEQTVSLHALATDCGIEFESVGYPHEAFPVPFTLALGSDRAARSVVVLSATGPESVTFSDVDSTGHLRSFAVTFPAPGSYTVSAMAVAGDTCDSTTVTQEMVVVSGDPGCVSVLSGSVTTFAHQTTEFEFTKARQWSEATRVEWTAEGSYPPVVESTESVPQTGVARASLRFLRPGRYVIRARMEDPSEEGCGVLEDSLAVTVVPIPCGATLSTYTRTPLVAGDRINFSVRPNAAWAFRQADVDIPAVWRVASGPNVGVGLSSDSNSGSAWASFRFERGGTYVIEVSIDDVDLGDGFVCDRWSETYVVEVLGPPAAGLREGVFALAAPATGPVTYNDTRPGVLAFSTMAAVVVPTERGPDGLDLVTGDPVEPIRRLLAPAALSDPPRFATARAYDGADRWSFAMIEGWVDRSRLTGWLGYRDDWDAPVGGGSHFVGLVDLPSPRFEPWPPALERALDPDPCYDSERGVSATEAGLVYRLYASVCELVGIAGARADVIFDIANSSRPDDRVVSTDRGGGSRGPVLVLTAGEPGTRGHVLQARSVDPPILARVGTNPSMVRAAGNVAVVANRGSDDVHVLFLEEGGSFAVVDSAGVGPGPTSVSLRGAPTGEVLALTTNGDDGTVSIVRIDLTGRVLSTSTQSLPAGFVGELHGIWMPDYELSFVVSAIGRDEIFVGRYDGR